MPIRNKKIILGVCGSIAAYKAAFLVRLLVKEGAEVQVIMTRAAQDFITPLTLATLSKRPVLTEFSSDLSIGQWNNHVDLGLWADAILVAPASAHTLSKFANGHCNDLLTAVYLSARCPVWVAPAMDLDMYQHPSVQKNIETLKAAGNYVLDAEDGELASGLSGVGRLAEPEHIVNTLADYFHQTFPLKGKQVLITAGPTQEPIDPVRYLTNASSGKMGYAIASEAADRGAKVILVSGPTSLSIDHTQIELHSVTTAQQMLDATQISFNQADIVVFAAAVADYAPTEKHDHKIKKKTNKLTLALAKTPDIAQTLGKKKRPDQILVGFALETHNELEQAYVKLEKKNLDIVVLNSLKDPGAGFGYDTNRITILSRRDKNPKSFSLKDKKQVAKDIWNFIEAYNA